MQGLTVRPGADKSRSVPSPETLDRQSWREYHPNGLSSSPYGRGRSLGERPQSDPPDEFILSIPQYWYMAADKVRVTQPTCMQMPTRMQGRRSLGISIAIACLLGGVAGADANHYATSTRAANTSTVVASTFVEAAQDLASRSTDSISRRTLPPLKGAEAMTADISPTPAPPTTSAPASHTRRNVVASAVGLAVAATAVTAVLASAPHRAAPKAVVATALPSVTPAVFLASGRGLVAERAAYQAGDASTRAAIAPLVSRANRDSTVRPVSVTTKTETPPGGTKHDYMSLSLYAWPNPATSSGLPYVTRDGQVNPEVNSISDKANLASVEDWSQELAYAYYFTGNQAYATKAADILSTWFLDPATAMNPSLTYAQAVKGSSSGQPGGIIDTADLPKVVDAAGLLAGSAAWTAADAAALKNWFRSYLGWLRTSPEGIAEAATTNNHAVWYADQVVSYALYTGQTALAQQLLRSAETQLIAKQIRPDGTQPFELTRTDTWSYSTYNVEAFVRLAELGSAASVDVWHYQAPNGASIRKALNYVVGYGTRMSSWPYKQGRTATLSYLVLPLYAAGVEFNDPAYTALGAIGAAAMSALYPSGPVLYYR